MPATPASKLYEDYIVNKTVQVGIQATSHEEALRAVMAGGGDILATNYTAQFRPRPANQQQEAGKQLQKA